MAPNKSRNINKTDIIANKKITHFSCIQFVRGWIRIIYHRKLQYIFISVNKQNDPKVT